MRRSWAANAPKMSMLIDNAHSNLNRSSYSCELRRRRPAGLNFTSNPHVRSVVFIMRVVWGPAQTTASGHDSSYSVSWHT